MCVRGSRRIGGSFSQRSPRHPKLPDNFRNHPFILAAHEAGRVQMTICEDFSLGGRFIASSLGLASALSMREGKSSGYAGMSIRKPSDNLDVMVLPSTLEALATTSDAIEDSPPRSPELNILMSPGRHRDHTRGGRTSPVARMADALLSRANSAAKELTAVLNANRAKRDASAVVLQERVRFQLVQRHRAQQAPRVKPRSSPRRRPVALFTSVLERFGIGYFSEAPACTIELAVDRIIGIDHRPIPPLHSPYRSPSPWRHLQSRYEHGRVLVHAQFARSLDRVAAGELRFSLNE